MQEWAKFPFLISLPMRREMPNSSVRLPNSSTKVRRPFSSCFSRSRPSTLPWVRRSATLSSPVRYTVLRPWSQQFAANWRPKTVLPLPASPVTSRL